MWTPRVRKAPGSLYVLDEPFLFSEIILVDRYGPPSSLAITGETAEMRMAATPGRGVVVVDDDGQQRFSGWVSSIHKSGDNTTTVTYKADTKLLWNVETWPNPTASWEAQTTNATDVQTAVHEVRILGYINRNIGSGAYHSGANDRRLGYLRLPTSLGRGTSGTSSIRFKNLGQLVADLSEAGNLRTTVKSTYDPDGSFHFDVMIDNTPDLSAWARFGDASSGDVGMLGEDWSYEIGEGVSVALSAGAGVGTARSLAHDQNTSRETAWGQRIEFFIDQRGTTDAGEIADGIAEALAENAPTVDVSAPIVAGDLTFGPGAGSIPIGAKVAVSLDGALVVDRIRQVTTTVRANEGEQTITVEPVVGSPDAGLTFTEKALRRALQRLRNLESQ